MNLLIHTVRSGACFSPGATRFGSSCAVVGSQMIRLVDAFFEFSTPKTFGILGISVCKRDLLRRICRQSRISIRELAL